MTVRIAVKILAFVLAASLVVACTALAPQPTGPAPLQTQAPLPTAGPSQPSYNDPTAAPAPADTPSAGEGSPFTAWVAYVGLDGNIWLAGGTPTQQVQVTFDGAGYGTDATNTPVVIYNRPRWSSDGALLAFERQAGQPVESGYNFTNSLWIYNASSGAASMALRDLTPTGYDWWPGKHMLAYSESVAPNYFNQGGPDASLARGIHLYNADTQAVTDLVKPVRGFHLSGPEFSPDGHYLSFREIFLTEGAGTLAFYDFATQQYSYWEEPVGDYAWNTDSQTIYFDTLTYIPQGNEAIYTRPLSGGEAMLFSLPVENGYASTPAVSQDGKLVAYLTHKDVLEWDVSTLLIKDIASGEARELGEFSNVFSLAWSAGWSHVLLNHGPFESSEIVLVSPYDGTVTVLAQGLQPDWNPAVQLQ